MPNLKLIICSIAVCFLLSTGAVHAAKPESEIGSKAEHSESFWDRWFGRSEKVRDNDDVDEKSKEKHQAKQKSDKHEKTPDRYFSDVERSRISDYYRRDDVYNNKGKKNKNKKKQLPPGLQKKVARGGQLPPGWQSKVARGEVLDSDILRHSVLIPDELARRLPALHDGETMRRVGDKVVRVLEGNGTVIDVIDLADVILR
ncbi:MAG: hypothetical protein JKX92_16030 [Porticoccaceae bacterium]|nr:hypothetical protein [Porticoccaceae bacterium]